MFIAILLLILGIAILIGGAELLVRGSASAARKLGISTIVIGLTVVAFGTSAPELVVNLISAVKGTTDLAVGNIVGSNIANILLILGVAAIITPLAVKKNTTFKEIPLALLAVALVVIFGNDVLFNGDLLNGLSRTDGIALMAFFAIFIYYTYGISKAEGERENVETYSWKISILMFLGGMFGLVLGGKMIVDNAVILATIAGMSENLIGLTIVAIGTSLPELATSIVAALKGHADIAVGNAVGSNIFNIFWVLGLTSVIRPIPFNTNINIDVMFACVVMLIFFLVLFIDKRHKLTRWEGIVFIMIYVGYLAYAIIR